MLPVECIEYIISNIPLSSGNAARQPAASTRFHIATELRLRYIQSMCRVAIMTWKWQKSGHRLLTILPEEDRVGLEMMLESFNLHVLIGSHHEGKIVVLFNRVFQSLEESFTYICVPCTCHVVQDSETSE